MRISDWSSDVCSSDLAARRIHRAGTADCDPQSSPAACRRRARTSARRRHRTGHMNLAQRKAFFARLAELNPAPRTELEYRTPFELLIAVMLSAQATDVSVNKEIGRAHV